jgi:hypothetical protein
MPPRETLAAAASRSNSEALVVRVVLAHPRSVFHPCTSGIHGGAAVVAATLVGYDDEETNVNDYFLYTDV